MIATLTCWLHDGQDHYKPGTRVEIIATPKDALGRELCYALTPDRKRHIIFAREISFTGEENANGRNTPELF